MESDQQHQKAQATTKTASDPVASQTVGATSSSSKLAAPAAAVGSALEEPRELETARKMLLATASEPTRQLEVVKRIIDVAMRSELATAMQLLTTIKDNVADPRIGYEVEETRLRYREAHHAGKLSGPRATADANSETSTVKPASTVTTTSAGGGGGGGGGGGSIAGPSGPHPPSADLLAADPALAERQKALRLKQYKEDPDIKGYIPPHDVNVSMLQRYTEISAQCSYSRPLRMLMLGSSRAEQGDSTLNYNFAGMEGYWMIPPSDGTPWTRGYRSTTITPKQYSDNKEVFLNYFAAGRGPIEKQLEKLRPGETLAVAFYGPRPAYATLSVAVAQFVAAIKARVESFRKAGDPAVALAEAGNVEAYIKIIHTTTPDGLRAYNSEWNYPDQVRNGIAIANADRSIPPT